VRNIERNAVAAAATQRCCKACAGIAVLAALAMATAVLRSDAASSPLPAVRGFGAASASAAQYTYRSHNAKVLRTTAAASGLLGLTNKTSRRLRNMAVRSSLCAEAPVTPLVSSAFHAASSDSRSYNAVAAGELPVVMSVLDKLPASGDTPVSKRGLQSPPLAMACVHGEVAAAGRPNSGEHGATSISPEVRLRAA
jgi:hypothetical protein